MRINHNIASLNTYRMLNTNATNGNKALEKLSSGLRINRAGDDAAGLAISEKMRAQVRGLDRAAANAQDGISMIQTAEGGLNEVHSILQRMRELADQSANGTNTADDRKAIQDEVSQLKKEIDRVGDTTEYNTQKLLNGNLKNASGISVGTNVTAGAVVGKLTAGVLSSTATAMSVASGALAATDYVQETINVDGTDININWQNLTTEEKAILENVGDDAASQNKAVDLIVSKINEAIDASGSGVAHVSGYVSSGMIAIQSGSTGVNSTVKTTVDAGDGVLASFTSGVAGANANTVQGADNYNGQALTSVVSSDMTVNGVLMSLTLSDDIASGATMASAAEILQDSINNSIQAYNDTTGKQTGEAGFIEDVTVTVSNDGRFEIHSQSGPVTFADRPGQTTVADLGLSQAQTDSSSGGGMTFQIGANKGQSISFGINDMRTAALGISGIDVSTAAGASNALTALDKAIQTVSSERSKLGAVQNRLEHTINNLNTSSENLTAAESRIRDVDMAKEMMEFTKNNILSQAAQAMLAQANQQPQGVLQLLR